jgi:hypothetical protein
VVVIGLTGCPWRKAEDERRQAEAAQREAEAQAALAVARARQSAQVPVEDQLKEQMKAVQTRLEIAMLDAAIESFERDFNVPNVPSRIRLNDPEDDASNTYLCKLFPRYNRTQKYKWNGQDSETLTLEGHECLVFFLGGIISGDETLKCEGFGVNPGDPTDLTGKDRKGPYFQFDAKRLKRDPQTKFLYYLDAFGKAPYAYFSAGTAPNGYNAEGDCPGLAKLVKDCCPDGAPKPYLEVKDKFWKPNGWQIISAGLDGKFGPGGVLWGKDNPVKTDTPGADDLANFAKAEMGKP